MKNLANPNRHFPMIVTPNLEKTKEFYQKAGFKIRFDVPVQYLQVYYGAEDELDLSFSSGHPGSGGKPYPMFQGSGLLISIPPQCRCEMQNPPRHGSTHFQRTGRQAVGLAKFSRNRSQRGNLRNASGVPILGEAGVGYHLPTSDKLPPLTFNSDEMEALVLGMRMVESWGDPALQDSARSTLSKVDAVVSPEARNQLKATALFSLSFSIGTNATKHLGDLRRAVNARSKITLAYDDAQGKATKRRARPLGLYFWGQAWTLAAYCELRQGFRNFRLDRIRTLSISKSTFDWVSPCTLADYVAAMTP